MILDICCQLLAITSDRINKIIVLIKSRQFCKSCQKRYLHEHSRAHAGGALTDYAQLFNYMRLLKIPCGIIVNFYPKFATIERYFYDTDNLEILTSDGIPFQSRQMGTGELARAPNASCFK
jgi:hypothetical protein